MNNVKVWAEKVIIPTYAVGEADKNPMFLENRVYQGSSGKIYPHSIIDSVSNEKHDQEYEAVFLENDFLQIMLLPELGGRVQRALDKTNGYDFVYYNRVIKPALVGLAGPWISGGIEFNWPQHHRPSTYDPVHYTIRRNPDGSGTVIIGEFENMFRTRCASEFTVYSDRAYLEIKTSLYNPTDTPKTFLWWANPAVAVNDDTQSVFPPDVHAVMDHGKRDVSSFPIAKGIYYKMDYSPGTDISRYRNIPVPTSYMAHHSNYDFVGNYDHGRRTGLLHIADHHISPGKKQWTWGNGEFGQAWDRNLTDEDGPYIELMTGCFTDNQPDFSWLMPYEGKSFTQYFMPYKTIGAVKNANRDAALNCETDGGVCKIGVYATGRFPGATICAKAGEKTIFTQTVDLAPAAAHEFSIETAETEIELYVHTANGRLLAECLPDHSEEYIPEPASAIPPPEEVATCEELFLFGMHIEQYRHATRDPAAYYLEGLRRDPTDARLNNAYGKLLLGRGLIAMSIPHFEEAVRKLTAKNPNPYDGEPLFNLGCALWYLGETDRAYDQFFKSAWNAAWQDAAFYRIGAIDMLRGDDQSALEHFELALERNARNLKARDAITVLLRETGRTTAAAEAAKTTLRRDPHDIIALRELAILEDRPQTWTALPGTNANTAIEYALCYAEWGRPAEAAALLREYISACPCAANVYPMVYYHLYAITGDPADLARAEAAPPDYCFPHRNEDMLVLEKAIRSDQPCARALYYLGNLWYDHREARRAIDCWEKAVAQRDDLATPHRNLALGYFNKCARPSDALQELRRAFEMNPGDSRVFFELDLMKKKLNFSIRERLEAMESHMDLVSRRDDLYLEYITCLNALGRHSEALEKTSVRHFHPWEGGEGKIPAQWRISLVQMAKAHIANEDPSAALELLTKAAGSYPLNFGEGKLTGAQENDVYYYTGLALRMLGREAEALDALNRAAKGLSEPTGMQYYNDQPPEMIYYQGLACTALGDMEGARTRFQRLIDYGTEHLNDPIVIDYFAVSLPELQIFDEDLDKRNRCHCLFMKALGHAGLGQHEALDQTLADLYTLDPNHTAKAYHIR